MKLKFIRASSVKSAVVEAGTFLDLEDHIAHYLIFHGRAVKADGSSGESEKKKKGGKS